MKTKCEECKGIGTYECDSEPGPYGHQITEQCQECNGDGWIDSVTYVDEICDKISDKFIHGAEAVFIAFSPRDQKTYHITYFIERGDISKESTPLLGGLTLSAESITHAITSFMNTSGVSESEIKYIVEL